MPSFLFVHGSAHGAWCWEKVLPLVRRRGCKAAAIDLPGRGQDRTWGWRVTMESCARAVAQAAAEFDEPALVVGHSYGGTAISVAAEMHPERFAGLVYLCAFVPEDGMDVADMIGASPRDTAPAEDAQILWHLGALMASPKTARKIFYGKLSDEEAAMHAARLTPEPLRPLSYRFRLTPERFGAIPKYYLECTEDRAIPIADQRRMHGRAAFAQIKTLAAGHSPFFECPEALAAALVELTAKRAAA